MSLDFTGDITMRGAYKGPERRKFTRLSYSTPLDYKVCKKQTISSLLKGYTSNISKAGLLCNIKERVKKDDILWLSFDRGTLNFCEDLDKRSFIYQNGIIAKVARIEHKTDGSYDVGVHFLTREEKAANYILPQSSFLTNSALIEQEEDSEEDTREDETTDDAEKINLEETEEPEKNDKGEEENEDL